MTPDEAANRFRALQRMIKKDLPIFIQERVAHNAVQMIHDRVVNRQKNFMGGSFSSYSTDPILTSGRLGNSSAIGRKLAGSKSKRKKLDWVTIKSGGGNVSLFEVKGGYAELRRLSGFGNRNKSFELTGQMWRGFGVKRTQKTNNTIIITLGGRNIESQSKIDWNSFREKISIIKISDREIKELVKMIDKELQRYIGKVGL